MEENKQLRENDVVAIREVKLTASSWSLVALKLASFVSWLDIWPGYLNPLG